MKYIATIGGVFLLLLNVSAQAAQKTAVFAGGCFWCLEKPFDNEDGVLKTTSGFSGSDFENPTYKQVSQGITGHIEVVEILYDSKRVSFERLLEIYWANIDPLDGKGQFCDRGHTYKPAIFYDGETELKLAEVSKEKAAEKLAEKIEVELIPADTFYAAEDYHQDYYLKNPNRYKYYRWRCGRDARLKEVWGKDAAGKSVDLFNK